MKTKLCSKCGLDKPVSDFCRSKGSLYYYTYCKSCKNAWGRKYRADNKEELQKKDRIYRAKIKQRRAEQLRERKYGLDRETYNKMLVDQEGLCAICLSPPSYRALDVDHDHITGEVRGLLCARCNLGIGQLPDPVLLRLAADYLERRAR